ncbi:hypothetical protein D3C78_899290 [compost metagenome]
MHIGEDTCQLAVHFLRVRGHFVPCTKSRLYMAHLNLLKKCRVTGQKGRLRIAVNKHDIRLSLLQHRIETFQNAYGCLRKRLTILHYIQIIIRMYFKKIKHLVQYLPVLCSYAYDGLNLLLALLQFKNKRSHLDRFRPRSEYGHYLQFRQYIPLLIWTSRCCALICTEHAVSRIAKAGNNIAFFIETLIQCRNININIRMSSLNSLYTFWRSNKAHQLNLVAFVIFQ